MMCKVTLLFLLGFLKLWFRSLDVVLACWGAALPKCGTGSSIRARLYFKKVNIPVLRRGPGRIQVGGLAWDRAHKDSIRAALVLSFRKAVNNLKGYSR
eukprot:1158071-Pelagomonas_calceolata.AAC.10